MGLLGPTLEEPVLPAQELVGDEGGDEIEGHHFLGLCLTEPRLQDIGHAGEAELAQGVIDFDEVHIGSPVLRSIRSR